ncbi:MAG TPA: ATP-binding cassette domain-containing protein [Bryobacteraceae bacterium]|nr:ATP-binding cassette domain-containing protein [Bryobacteraceae bacterium]
MSLPSNQAICLEHLTKAFSPERKVLDDVSFSVPRGEVFCLLGKSGTGKSVTLKLIMALLRPDEGKILIDGEDVLALDTHALQETRKKVGFLFQNAALFDSISLRENLAFPLRRHTAKPEAEIAEVVKQKLEAVGLGNDGDKMPSDLSGGMKKRAGLARALVLDPQILLVDEPSSGLDRITAGEIHELLGELKEKNGTSMILVTHDPAGVRRFTDQIAVLDGGRIVANGTPDELEQSDNELVRELVQGGQDR